MTGGTTRVAIVKSWLFLFVCLATAFVCNGAAAADPCTDDNFTPEDNELERIKKECERRDQLCITPIGQVIHKPELAEGETIEVVLYHPDTANLTFTLETEFKKTVVMQLGDIVQPNPAETKRLDAPIWKRGPSSFVELTSAGKLAVTSKAKPPTPPEDVTTPKSVNEGPCRQDTTLEKTAEFQVTGHYHFMFGIMPTYAGLYSRNHTLHRSDDGVQRVYAQDVHQVDLAVTLSGYPFGVSADSFGAVGILLASSLMDLGKRWYAGLEFSSPIGLGIAAGAAFIMVPELDQDFVSGQPLEGSQVPTHNEVVPTWFIGINVQAELFRLAFKGLAGDDEG